MKFNKNSLKKLENLISDIKSVYGTNTITYTELLNIIYMNPEDYPSINSILNKPSFKVSRGIYSITLPKNDDLSQDIKNDAVKLLKELFS